MFFDLTLRRILLIGGAVLGGLILLILFVNSYTRVNPGYMGVQYSLASGLKEETLKEGGHLHSPLVNVYEYPVSTETVRFMKPKKDEDGDNTALQVNTGDGKSVAMDVTFAYSMKPEELPHIFKRFRRQDAEWVANNYIKQEIYNVLQNTATKYSVLQVYSQNREKISLDVHTALRESFDKDGIVLEKFTISDVRPDKKTMETLQKVAEAEANREVIIRERKNTQEENLTIVEKKKNELLSAQKDAEIAKITAQKEADVLVINAQAEAESNKIKSASMTEQILRQKYIDVLPQIKFPQVYGGGGSILNMPESFLKEQEPAKETKK